MPPSHQVLMDMRSTVYNDQNTSKPLLPPPEEQRVEASIVRAQAAQQRGERLLMPNRRP